MPIYIAGLSKPRRCRRINTRDAGVTIMKLNVEIYRFLVKRNTRFATSGLQLVHGFRQDNYNDAFFNWAKESP